MDEDIWKQFESYRKDILLSIEPLRDAMAEVKRTLALTVRNSMLEMIQVQQSVSEIFKGIQFPNYSLDIEEIRAAIPRLKDEIQQYKLILIDLSFPPFDGLDFHEIRQIISVYVKGGRGKARRVLYSYIKKEFNRDMIQMKLNYWQKSKFINKSRLKILEEIVFAHQNKKYYCSVSTMIPQIEGVLIRAKKHKGKIQQKHVKRYVGELKQEFDFSVDDVFVKFVNEILYTGFEVNKRKSSNLSRNAILHGIDIKYGSEINSIKCIILFDYLLEKLEGMNS